MAAVKRAGYAWIAGLFVVLGYEAYAILNSTPGDTLSEWVWANPHPMLAFAAGVVCGHLFWQRRPPAVLIILALPLPLLLGAKGCSQDQQCAGLAAAVEAACGSDRGGPEAPPACQAARAAWEAAGCAAQPVPVPTFTPTPTPVPTPTPTPTPSPGAAKCWLPLPPGARLGINAHKYGNGLDSTYWVENGSAAPEAMRAFWEAVGRPAATTAGHLEGMRDRALCEMEYAGGCPGWSYRSGGEAGICHNDTASAAVSCDHFGNPVDRDDPQTPTTGSTLETLRGFEGEPKACGLQRDELGPMAGFFVMPQCTPGRECSVKACLPDRSVCSDYVLVDWR